VNNQPLAFGLLLGGGVLLVAGLTGKGLGSVLQGTAGGVPNQGSVLQGAAAGGLVAGVGTTVANGSKALGKTLAGAASSSTGYVDPLKNVTAWNRTDQGVDATLPVGAPIVAPGDVKILGVEPDWYNGQPFVYFKLLSGPDAGKVQYVAEQITNIAAVGSIVREGDPIARYAASGTAIEYGWATDSGQTLAMATTGYKEGYATTAGKEMRTWLNSLGAGAGTGAGLSIGAGPDPDNAAAALAHEESVAAHPITTLGYVVKNLFKGSGGNE
jgi:hypothetical protein